jgi:hypothetical protein
MKQTEVIIPNLSEQTPMNNIIGHLFHIVDETENAIGKVLWNFAGTCFIHPFLLAPLAIYKIQSEKEIVCSNMSLSLQSHLNSVYFDRMLHFEAEDSEAAKTVMGRYVSLDFIPICSFSMNDANKDAFYSIFRDVIISQIHFEKVVSTPVSYFLSELIDNIYEHSGSEKGFLFSQYMKDENCLNLCIADEGITVFNSFLQTSLFLKEINMDEAEALRMANEGRSTKNRPGAESRGYRISTSKRMLVEGLGGSFFMLSGGAFHRYEGKDINYYANVESLFRWKGTLILLRIPLKIPENFNYTDYLE